jgi:hypothetical protein
MSKALYRALIIGGVLAWLQAGMSLSTVLTTLDAGANPRGLDLLLLAIWTIMGLSDAVALLRVPVPLASDRAVDVPAT